MLDVVIYVDTSVPITIYFLERYKSSWDILLIPLIVKNKTKYFLSRKKFFFSEIVALIFAFIPVSVKGKKLIFSPSETNSNSVRFRFFKSS